MKRIIARIFALTAALLCVATVAMPAQAAALPVLYAAQDDMAHSCVSVGAFSNGVTANLCADILTKTVSGGIYQAIGQIEAYCQLGNAVVHCQGIWITGGMYRQSNVSWIGAQWDCSDGSTAGTCPNNGQRKYFQTNMIPFDTATWEPVCTNDVNGYTAFWTNILSATFVLDNEQIDLNGHFETGHYFVCAY